MFEIINPSIVGGGAGIAVFVGILAFLWEAAVAAVHLPETRAGTNVLVLPALNQRFDLATVRLTATQMHPPLVIYAMLVGMAFRVGPSCRLPGRGRHGLRLVAPVRLCRHRRRHGPRDHRHGISATRMDSPRRHRPGLGRCARGYEIKRGGAAPTERLGHPSRHRRANHTYRGVQPPRRPTA